jgi:hypothetical protein
VRPYNQGSDFPTLLALIVAVGFPLLLLSLVFDVFPRERFDRWLTAIPAPWAAAEPRASPSPAPLLLPSPSPTSLNLALADWPIPNGHFYTQTNGLPPLTSATGYQVVNAGGLGFWGESQRLGGIDVLGYPLSNRFNWRGVTVQVFQKFVLQGPEAGGEVSVLNLMDELSVLGKDDFLKDERSIPPPLPPEFDRGRSPAEVPSARLALLVDDPALERAYKEATDPFRQFGLPTSRVTDMGEYLTAIRCQRAVLQRWKQDVAWAKAGDVTLANVGQIAIEAGLFPTEGLRPSVSAPPQR